MKRLSEKTLAVVSQRELDSRARKLWFRGYEVEVPEARRLRQRFERSAVQEVVARGAVRALAEPRRRVRLWIEVDDEHRLAGVRQACGEVDGRRRLADAALLVR